MYPLIKKTKTDADKDEIHSYKLLFENDYFGFRNYIPFLICIQFCPASRERIYSIFKPSLPCRVGHGRLFYNNKIPIPILTFLKNTLKNNKTNFAPLHSNSMQFQFYTNTKLFDNISANI